MPIAPENYQHIRQVLYKRAAIVLNDDKQYLVESRLFPVAKQAGLHDVDALVGRLRIAPESPLLQSIIDAMTTNETSFFRDATPFHVLRDRVLPELIERRSALRTIRIWSAGCASGQEPYSIAMMWREEFAHLPDWQLRILATDISSEMLERARDGRFSHVEVQRGLAEQQRATFFRRVADQWQIEPTLRSMIDFQPLNMIDAWPTTVNADVIFLRNVLVYFDMATKQDILRRLRAALTPDGYLFLGSAETTVMIDDAFERVVTAEGSYYRVKDR